MSVYQFAGVYGPVPITDAAGRPLPLISIKVFAHGTTNLATIYTDRTKGSTAANPTTTDALGNLTFFADPGEYDIFGNNATLAVTLYMDPVEPMQGDNTGALPTPTLADTAHVEAILAASATIAAKAPLASPALTGSPTAPTATVGTNTTQLATTAFVQAATGGGTVVASVFGRSGAVTATSGDYTVGQVTGAAPLASPALTGTPTAPTAGALTNSTQVATTAYADAAVAVESTRATTAEALKAPLASPALTGTPTAPTAAALTNTTQVGTTAYTDAAITAAKSATQTLTNKRITRRYVTVTQSATPTINTDNTDTASITGLAQAITSMTTNLTGTPVGGDQLIVEITDNGTARAITWGASFEASTVALPTTTVLSTKLTVGFIWNVATSAWRCVAVA